MGTKRIAANGRCPASKVAQLDYPEAACGEQLLTLPSSHKNWINHLPQISRPKTKHIHQQGMGWGGGRFLGL